MIVTIGRSEAIDKVIDEISDANMTLPGLNIDNEKVDMAIDHFTNIAAEKVETKNGNAYIMYVNTGPDHFLHAKVYADIASGGIESNNIGGSAPPLINNKSRDRINNGKFGSMLKTRHRSGRRNRR